MNGSSSILLITEKEVRLLVMNVGSKRYVINNTVEYIPTKEKKKVI
ncbi:hypothetical protein KHA80_22410 [Anaerobacillus sp. HL2]|nr:hypothetical protein KHA80_22410 [Anaerobacillus sp. HL2]